MKNKNLLTFLLGIICVLLIAAAGITVIRDRKEPDRDGGRSDDTSGRYLTYEGNRYKKNVDIETILFLGVDRTSETELENHSGDAGQSDSLNLLILDKEEKSAQMLQISRDSVVKIDVRNDKGETIMSVDGQIALQYAYGDGGEESCRLAGDRVSELLGGIKIDSFVSLTLDGIAAATDAVGGVTMVIPQDYTAINPAFEANNEVTFDGAMAEQYVRSRNTEELDSNNQRMERQSQFMTALIQKMQSGQWSDAEMLSMYQKMEPYMATNMTADEMKELTEYTYDEEILTLPGQVTEKVGHAQFITDTAEVQKMVVELFYKKV